MLLVAINCSIESNNIITKIKTKNKIHGFERVIGGPPPPLGFSLSAVYCLIFHLYNIIFCLHEILGQCRILLYGQKVIIIVVYAQYLSQFLHLVFVYNRLFFFLNYRCCNTILLTLLIRRSVKCLHVLVRIIISIFVKKASTIVIK